MELTPEQFIKHLEQKIAKKRNSLVDHLTAKFVEVICTETPIESGHAHQAWITAADEAADRLYQSQRIERAAEKHRTKASGDPEAEKHGKGNAKTSKHSLTVSIENKLPFVQKMELGIPITVGDKQGNRGPKEHGLLTEGELYAPRLANESGSWATGWLMWREGSTPKFAKTRTTKTGSFAKAIAAVKAEAEKWIKKENT